MCAIFFKPGKKVLTGENMFNRLFLCSTWYKHYSLNFLPASAGKKYKNNNLELRDKTHTRISARPRPETRRVPRLGVKMARGAGRPLCEFGPQTFWALEGLRPSKKDWFPGSYGLREELHQVSPKTGEVYCGAHCDERIARKRFCGEISAKVS